MSHMLSSSVWSLSEDKPVWSGKMTYAGVLVNNLETAQCFCVCASGCLDCLLLFVVFLI